MTPPGAGSWKSHETALLGESWEGTLFHENQMATKHGHGEGQRQAERQVVMQRRTEERV